MKTKLKRISKKQQQWLIQHVEADCKIDGSNWGTEDPSQRCIIGSFMTKDDIDKLLKGGGYRSATFSHLPPWIQEKIMAKTQLDEEELGKLQHANDSVEADWTEEADDEKVIVQRQKKVMRTLLSIFKRRNRK